MLSSLIFTSGSVMRTIGKSCFADLGWKDICFETDNFDRIYMSAHIFLTLSTQKYPDTTTYHTRHIRCVGTFQFNVLWIAIQAKSQVVGLVWGFNLNCFWMWGFRFTTHHHFVHLREVIEPLLSWKLGVGKTELSAEFFVLIYAIWLISQQACKIIYLQDMQKTSCLFPEKLFP